MSFNMTSNASILYCSVIFCLGSNLFFSKSFHSSLLSWQETAWLGKWNVASGVGKASLNSPCLSVHLSIMLLHCGRWQLAVPHRFSSFLMCKIGDYLNFRIIGDNVYQAL